jgi:hypothetical protein
MGRSTGLLFQKARYPLILFSGLAGIMITPPKGFFYS